ncbi:cytochrome c-type biogenesis protein CcmH [Limibaculum sp. FT325]|uniref:cytochrome c-type biogenesis protein n=1 Tax=Thermohalobaculum sediminis TaxID=2939436 RepID=UPI0020BE877E|nr:cytochrome c-type biogenesis protein [Limibaculum sediminis]MCL5777289.1 cytochrome c-type biogenesis protein CcmH [Limibaculum sediminis]
MRLVLAVVLMLVALPAHAVQPDEMLADPALEARAREISKEIRCLVCQNESIDDSNAELARDLRILVRERVASGDSDAAVKQYLVDRYGEFVLLKPTFGGFNLVIWLAGPVLLILGGAVALIYLRRRAPQARPADAPLSAEERAALERVLKDG